jgi:hypothetical protein
VLIQNNLDYDKIVDGLLQRMATYKAVSSTPVSATTQAHGPGALLSYPGMSPNVFNAMILPHLGLQALLPVRSTRETTPVYAIMTGVTAHSGSNPTGECDDPPTAGLMKICMQSTVLGRLSMQTRVFDIEHFGEVTNRGEFRDLRLVGNPLANAPASGVPTLPGATAQNALSNEVTKSMFELGSNWAIKHAPLLYEGNPSNNTAGNGYKEYRGLELLVNTGYRDAETGVACPAADSIVASFQNKLVSDSNNNIVQTLSRMFFRLRHIAARTGMGQVRWVMSMPYGMFFYLSEVWAYYYVATIVNAISIQTGVTYNIEGRDIAAMRDAMRGNLESRTGQFLIIDGQRVDVVLDDAISETEYSPGKFQSDIYVIPLTASVSPDPLTYMEYFDYDAPGGAMEGARLMAPGDTFYTTDGGMYIWTKKPPTNLCVQVAVWTRPTLVLRTPYLAMRLTNVAWSPDVHERSPFHESAYFVDGGKTTRAGYSPSFWSPTA